MFTNKEADYLLALEKVLENPSQVVDLSKKKNRLKLFSHQNSDYRFWLELTTNEKIILKTSLHHLESNSFTGLLRIDFKGGHKNPETIKSTVPEYLKKHAGLWITPNTPHLHVYVQGYRDLQWAIPLNDTDFKNCILNKPSDVSSLLIKFAEKINVKSKINIQEALL